MRITLVRHGRSAYQHSGWLSVGEFAGWCAAYDAAGVAPHEVPPAAVRALAANAALVVASDLPRARESADLLAPGAPRRVSALLREADLPIPRWAHALRLPVIGWIAIARAAWAVGARDTNPVSAPVCEPRSAAAARARAAAAWLAALAAEDGEVVAVTHGAFRPLVAQALRARGWRGVRLASFSYWSAWTFEAPIPGRDNG